MFKIVISPAKSLNFEPLERKIEHSFPIFKKEAFEVVKVLKKLKPNQLSDLMNISDKLAQLNWERNNNYKADFTLEDSKQSLFAFDGDVYSGIEAETLNDSQVEFLQENLRILSGQYGYLKPLDLIMPYRLEMGTKLSVKKSKNLYDFWSKKVTSHLNSELNNGEVLINLASEEYFKVLDKKAIKHRIITPVFKDYSNGKLKTISFFAKKARGYFVRYLSTYSGENLDDYILKFSVDGYSYSEEGSTKDKPLFTR